MGSDKMESIEKLRGYLKATDSWRYVTICPDDGTGIRIFFDRRMPVHIPQQIKSDIGFGLYPDLEIVNVYDRKNLFNMKVVIKDDKCP